MPQYSCNDSNSFDDNNNNNNLELKIKRVGKKQSFQALTDSILIRLIQIANPGYYKRIIIGIYNQRMLFSFTNVFMYVFFIIHRLPMYICLIILTAQGSNSQLSLSLGGVILLEVLMIVCKVRYRNGVPAKIPSLVAAASTSAREETTVRAPATQFRKQSGLQPVAHGNGIISSQPNGNSVQFIGAPNANVPHVAEPVQNVSDECVECIWAWFLLFKIQC